MFSGICPISTWRQPESPKTDESPKAVENSQGRRRSLEISLLTALSSSSLLLHIPDLEQIISGVDTSRSIEAKECLRIELNESAQLELLDKLASYYDETAFPERPSNTRMYFSNNSFFTCTDAVVLYGIPIHLRPNKVIEAGSGFSSALMSDTSD